MLVLSREPDQKIIIQAGEHKIVVSVVEIRRGLVRLGVDAAIEVQIDREEVYLAKQASKA